MTTLVWTWTNGGSSRPWAGVVRVALPQDGTIFCTWQASVDPDHLIERIGVLSPRKLHELDVALQLAGE